MRQAALIYLFVTARLQLINCFKHRPLHELNSTHNLNLHLFCNEIQLNILVNSQMQCIHVIQTQAQKP